VKYTIYVLTDINIRILISVFFFFFTIISPCGSLLKPHVVQKLLHILYITEFVPALFLIFVHAFSSFNNRTVAAQTRFKRQKTRLRRSHAFVSPGGRHDGTKQEAKQRASRHVFSSSSSSFIFIGRWRTNLKVYLFTYWSGVWAVAFLERKERKMN